jgi:hypothetical protein
MPIEAQHGYTRFLDLCKKFYLAYKGTYGTPEKIGIGILAFSEFVPAINSNELPLSPITLNRNMLRGILEELESEYFRIDLCEFNNNSAAASSRRMSNVESQELLKFTQDQGFEAKLFSSFGRDNHSGCGMLNSDFRDRDEDGEKTKEMYKLSLKLLHYAICKKKEITGI